MLLAIAALEQDPSRDLYGLGIKREVEA